MAEMTGIAETISSTLERIRLRTQLHEQLSRMQDFIGDPKKFRLVASSCVETGALPASSSSEFSYLKDECATVKIFSELVHPRGTHPSSVIADYLRSESMKILP